MEVTQAHRARALIGADALPGPISPGAQGLSPDELWGAGHHITCTCPSLTELGKGAGLAPRPAAQRPHGELGPWLCSPRLCTGVALMPPHQTPHGG